jgi:predicted transcriptional regulator
VTESTIVVRVNEDLKTAFAEAAKATDRTASQLVRDFMRAYVDDQKVSYDAWFRKKVEAGLRDLRAGRVKSSEEVERVLCETPCRVPQEGS